MTRLIAEGSRIVEALAKASIGVLVLKGAHTSLDYFPEPGTRPMSDLDLMVSPGNADHAAQILEREGFACEDRHLRESTWRKRGVASQPVTAVHLAADDPWTIDLHYSLDFLAADGAPLARLDRAEPLTSPDRWTASPEARVLGQPLLLLHLAVHAGSGFHSLNLMRLLELVLVIRKDVARGKLDWNEFLDLAARACAVGYAYPALAMCGQLAPDAVPAHVLNRCREDAPIRVVRMVERHGPASIHRVARCSLAEHFMWTQGLGGWSRQLAADIFPRTRSAREALDIYNTRFWRLLKMQVSR